MTEHQAGHRAHLLVVDDNKVNRMLLKRSLELQGHRVAMDDDCTEGLDRLGHRGSDGSGPPHGFDRLSRRNREEVSTAQSPCAAGGIDLPWAYHARMTPEPWPRSGSRSDARAARAAMRLPCCEQSALEFQPGRDFSAMRPLRRMTISWILC